MIALSHRVNAIRGLNSALSHQPQSQQDADALIATCYALTLQASYMGCSTGEFLVQLRGVNLVTTQDWASKFGTVFKALTPEEQEAVAFERLTTAPVLSAPAIKQGMDSLERFKPLCTEPLAAKIVNLYMEVLQTCQKSSHEGMSFRCRPSPLFTSYTILFGR